MLKQQILYALKTCYRYLPVGAPTRTYMKDKFYSIFSFALKDTQMYHIWYNTKYGLEGFTAGTLVQKRGRFSHKQIEQPGRIGVQLHLFYIDLAEEFFTYLKNMPFDFDLLVSIVDEKKKTFVEEYFSRIPHLQRCIVRVVPNRGRDVAPFIVGFADLLSQYDFIAHIHSKKSYYTGTEQEEWRNYLLEGLFGSEEWLREIFGEFMENENLGLIYPRPVASMPYVAFTWMSNYPIGMELLVRLNVAPNTTEYFDFSAGTMFWVRSKAIRRLFSSGISIDDFPEEQGQTDGTLAHAVERTLVLLTMDEGMDYYEADVATGTYTMNCGTKNMGQYFSRSARDIDFVLSFDVISFDIFDTLIMRKISSPSFVNDLIGLNVEKKLGIHIDFSRCRLEAELAARQKLSENQDCSLNEIYKEFAKVTGLSSDICEKIRGLEVETELEQMTPRLQMLQWFKTCCNSGKRVILTSDMYLTKKEMERVLTKYGIQGYDELYLSSETGLRKDTGAIWKKFVDDGMKKRMIHIGDNEVSDWQRPVDYGLDSYHIMSSMNLFSLTRFGSYLLHRRGRNMSLWGSILLGTILWKHFDNPFLFHENKGQKKLKSFYELGYVIYGPILLTYICWLFQETRRDQRQAILFMARDGYFLKPLYEMFVQRLNITALPSVYFLTSRRSITMASVRTLEDIFVLLETHYEGTIQNFFKVRFGIEIDDGQQDIVLPGRYDKQLLRDMVCRYQDAILDRAKGERDAYEAYIDSLNLDFSKKIALVDMGYAGTIQYYLSLFVNNEDFIGYYFATNRETRFGNLANERMRGCFAFNEDSTTISEGVYKYHLLMEAVLTSPEGQLNYFERQKEKIVPIYGEKEFAQKNIDSLQNIHVGILDYCKDVLDTYGTSVLDIPMDTSFLDDWMTCFVLDEGMLDDGLKAFYVIDDSFCNLAVNNVLDFYRHGRNG